MFLRWLIGKDPMSQPSVCVVVSYWVGHPRQPLYRLLRQMQRMNAGIAFDLVIVCNGGDRQPLQLPNRLQSLRPTVLNRVNQGYNLGAWNYGWQAAPGYDYYLFLQDECFIKRPGWVSEFVFRMQNDAGMGLLGETIMWDNMTWEYVRIATDRDLGIDWFPGEAMHPLDFYQHYLRQRGIPLGEIATHVQTLICFSSGAVLTQLGGLLVGTTYREAVACEIGLSALVRAKGYRISKVKDAPYTLLGHLQWTWGDHLKRQLRHSAATLVKQILGRAKG